MDRHATYDMEKSVSLLKEVLLEVTPFLDASVKKELEKILDNAPETGTVIVPAAIVQSLSRLDMIKRVWTDEEFTSEFGS